MIRNIVEDDCERVSILLNQMSPHPIDVDLDELRDAIGRTSTLEHMELFGFEEDGGIVGMCTVGRVEGISNDGRPFSVIENIVVEESRRSKGIGRSLINHALEIARGWGCYKVVLETGTKQEWKLSFYEKCGLIRGEKTAFIKRFE
jgi:GNAT superfamily N-acetyltransferase